MESSKNKKVPSINLVYHKYIILNFKNTDICNLKKKWKYKYLPTKYRLLGSSATTAPKTITVSRGAILFP